jgi:pimeloyl-ACP methyl ester carboxylesterase
MHLCALSWGGKLALAIALQHPQAWQSLTLITPGLRAQVDLPLRHKIAAALNLVIGGRTTFAIPIEPEMFTNTPGYFEFIRRDPWRLKRVTARFLRTTLELDHRIARRDSRLSMPALVLLAGRDRIIDNAGVAAIVRRLQPEAQLYSFDEAEHAVIFDCVDDVAEQILDHLRSVSPQRRESMVYAPTAA